MDYGLRYDFSTLLREQYGRMQSVDFNMPNPVAGNRPGNVIYEATCHCSFNQNYPYAFGPRIGLAYQIDSRTVLRMGTGISYGTSANNAFLSASVADFYSIGPRGYGDAATILQLGNPYAPGNIFGNPTLVWPDYSNHYPSEVAPGVRPPQSPFISIDRNAGRPPRIFQWSIGIQREVLRGLVIDAAYVGNRGVWWTAPVLAIANYNAFSPQELQSQWGLDIHSADDRTILTLPISDPRVLARFPQFANPDKAVYPGFPNSQTLINAIRPHPQWGAGIPPFLGPPLGTTWYDSLQMKVTKRYSRGLDLQAAFTWQKELTLGVNSDTSYFTPGTVLVNDVYDRQSIKQISALSRPFMFNVSFTYTTPKIAASAAGMRTLSMIARDWVIGGVLRYQSGYVIATPGSNNNVLTQLGRGPENNPALFGGGHTFYNRVPGKNPLLVDPNCHCFDPTRTLVLNPDAWVDAGPGEFGTAAAYYNDYRWQRQPAESMSIGRNFHLKEKVTLNVRAEFQNIFNRVFLSPPSVGGFFNTNPATPPATGANGAYTSGYGYVNTVGGVGTSPRSGQFVIRFIF